MTLAGGVELRLVIGGVNHCRTPFLKADAAAVFVD
jgi:hypothetical protein